MNSHEKLNYIELPATNIELVKAFFTKVFKWSFVDYGPEYTAFSDQGLDGGFFKSELVATTANGSVLLVFYSLNVKDTKSKIENAGGIISRPIFEFPGVGVVFIFKTLAETNMLFGRMLRNDSHGILFLWQRNVQS